MSEDHHAERERQFRELRVLVNRWDPIGVLDDDDAPVDEYDCLVDLVLVRLENGHGAEDIGRCLGEVLEDRFGLCPLHQAHVIRRFVEEAIRWYDGEVRQSR